MPAAVSLSQMVDLSLGTPEIGSVNFNVLHTLLHALIKKLNIGDHKTEINEHDRDFLSSSKIRARSTLSDADSGRGEDSEDAVSEKSGAPPFRPSPYHRMELKVEKLAQQLEELNQLPNNTELFTRTTESKSDSGAERPISDMWQIMKLQKRVAANEEGVEKLFSLIEDMMKEMKDLKDANRLLQEQLKGLNLDDLKKRLGDLENITKELGEKFAELPSPDDFATVFVTWPGLEDALKGIRDEITQPDRVVIEMSSQTDMRPAKATALRIRASRPGSSRTLSRVSTPGPSDQLLDILERLGKLDSDHLALKQRVDDLEEEMKNKLDKSALQGLGIPPELLAEIGRLKTEVDRLAGMMEKLQTNTNTKTKVDDSINNMLKHSVDAASDSLKDNGGLKRAQQAILQLQAEVEKLHETTSGIIDENKQRTKEIQDILITCDKLQEEKADKTYVQMEVDVKADKKSMDSKVNTKEFDKATNEIQAMIKEILDKLNGHDEDWKKAYSKLTEDIDGKLDRLELDPLKEWLEARLKALNDKLKKYQSNMDYGEDDAAGIRKQLIQKFHCISCDRPVDMLPSGPVPSLPSQMGLNPTKSPRPYTTFELDQIRQYSKSYNVGKNMMNYECVLAEKQLATLKRSNLRAFLVHIRQDIESVARYNKTFTNSEITDYYATPRPCGGTHTMTYPHKRNTKLTHLSHLFREDEAIVIPATKEEIDIQGADGHIYRGRQDQRNHQKLEARFPTNLSQNNNNTMGMNVRPSSPQPAQYRPKPPNSTQINQQRARPVSARTPLSPRPSSGSQCQPQGSRPTSAMVTNGRSQVQGHPPPVPHEAFVDGPSQGTGQEQGMQLEMPSA